jgi:iron complex outermembrane receptor protein
MAAGQFNKAQRTVLAMLLPVLALNVPVPAENAPRTAPTNLAELSIEELMNLEVTSVSRRTEVRGEAAAAVYVITQEDIRRSGATSIPELLRNVPGLNVARLDANKWAITSRGFNDRFANKLLVLIDGRSVYTPLFAGTYWHAQNLILEDIERIEVIRGPGGALWGANAVNGVINIITKSARDTQGGLWSGIYGTEDLITSLRYGGKVSDNTLYRLNLKYRQTDDLRLGSGEDAADGWDAVSGGMRLEWDNGGSDKLVLQGSVSDGEDGQTFVLPTLYPPYARYQRDDTNTKNRYLQVRYTHEFSEESGLELMLFVDSLDRRDLHGGDIRDSYDVELQHRLRIGDRHQVVWGSQIRFTDFQPYDTPYSSFDPASREDWLFSVFAQDTISLAGDELRLTVGGKLEHNDYTGVEFQPNVRLAWMPSGQQTLWAAISRAVRTPARAETDVRLTNKSLPFTLIGLFGNKDLDAERVWAYEAGYRFQVSEQCALDLAAYLNKYDRLRTIEMGLPYPELFPLPLHLMLPAYGRNNMTATGYGIEAAVDWRALHWWRLRLAYAWSKVEVHLRPRTIDILSGSSEDSTPRHQASFESQMNLPGRTELGATLRYVGELASLNVDDYWNLDLRFGWQARDNLSLELVGQNLLHSQHEEFSQLILPTVPTEVQRGVYGKFTWRF